MNIAESISWPKDFQELKVIDGLLRCGICYDYLRTCLVTPCSHNYCSFCIRKSMQYKTQCPMCLKETFEVSLQNNRVLDEIVENFNGIRDKLIRHLRIAEVHLSVQQANHLNAMPDTNATPIKMKTEVGKTSTGKQNPLKLKTPHSTKKKSNNSELKSSTPKTGKKKKNISSQMDNLVKTDNDDDNVANKGDHDANDHFIADKENNLSSLQKIVKEKANGIVIPEIFLQPISPKKKVVTKHQEPEDVLTVPCPVCNVQIPDRNINIHLDSCLYRSERPVRKQTKPERKRSPLPKLVYNMMFEKDLRKKLKEYGLEQRGDKKTLISRLQRFTVLYNSECDAIEPRPVSAIIQQIENEEKDEKKMQQSHRPVINRNTDPKIIEEENNKYIQENKNSFASLIKSLREREGRKSKQVTIIDDDNGDEEEGSNNDICDDSKGNTTVIEKKIKHSEEDIKRNLFSVNPSTSTACTSVQKEDKRPIEIVDESSDDELCVPSIIPRFTPPKHLKIMNKSCIDNGSEENDGQSKCIVEATTSKKTDKITHTQKLSDEELGIQIEISSDVNSVYQASDNEEDEVNSSDNESISLLANINEQNLNAKLPNGNELRDDDDDDGGGGGSKNENNPNSQIKDPDFVINTQDLEEENTEEFFTQRHKAKKRTPARNFPLAKLPNGNVLRDDDDDDGGSKNENNPNSQIKDPDFVINTQDLEEENTEEFFTPRYKAKVTPARNSKRKVIKPILSDSEDSGDDNRANHEHDKDGEIEDTPRRSLRKRVKH